MAQGSDIETNERPAYEKPILVCYGSLQETTKTVGEPLPGVDAFPGIELYGDPS